MNDTLIKSQTEAENKHHREVFWQIAFPLILGNLIVLGLAAWVIITTVTPGGSIRQAADTSLILLLMPTLIMALIPLILLAVLVYGVIWVNQKLPSGLHQIHGTILMVRDGIETGADKLAEPVIRFKSKLAAFEVFKRKS